MARATLEGGGNAGSPNAKKTAAQIAEEARVAAAKNASKPVAPTSGVVPGFKPQVKMPAPANQPGSSGFVGPVAPTPTSPIPYGTPVPGFTPAFPMPAPAAEPGEPGFVGPVPVGTKDKPKGTESDVDKDAYALLESIFRSYGLESLVPVIRGYMEQNLGVEQAKLKLKTEQAYKDRFKGNELRVARGLNAIGEAEYLELENDYSETLRAYGMSDYFGIAIDATSRLSRQQKIADVIGNDISATEFKDRIKTAVSRVKEADTNTKDAFKALYGINDSDLVRYFLDPKQGSEQLKTKATAAEISGAAVSAGLSGTSIGTAEELAKLGVDKSTALEGYASIAGFLPRTEFLGQIYDETGIQYNRASAEAETFKGLASEKRKREQLKAIEEASFGGSSGRLRTGRASENQGSF